MPSIRIVAKTPSLRQFASGLVRHPPPADNERPDLLILELTGDSSSEECAILSELRAVEPGIRAVGVSWNDDAAAVTRQGVRLMINDYFRLPDEGAEFQKAVRALLERPPALERRAHDNMLLGSTPEMARVRQSVARVALTGSSVLITGETGTGKELVAKLIHKSSPRRDKPFVCVNSAALPETLLESELFGFEKGAFTGAQSNYPGKLRQAHRGTLFFDEIGDLSLAAQAKVLRAIETREVQPLGGRQGVEVDVRFIAATNRDLEALTRTAEFREDLFYRLNVVRIELPPLRRRRQDIPQLLEHFINVYNGLWDLHVESFQPDAAALLQSYEWPGNIRELRNVVEASFVNAASNRIGMLDLPERLRRAFEDQTPQDSRNELVQTLLATSWNISRAAERLRCSRMTVYRKMAQHSISKSKSA